MLVNLQACYQQCFRYDITAHVQFRELFSHKSKTSANLRSGAAAPELSNRKEYPYANFKRPIRTENGSNIKSLGVLCPIEGVVKLALTIKGSVAHSRYIPKKSSSRILVPRDRDPCGQRHGSRPLFYVDTWCNYHIVV